MRYYTINHKTGGVKTSDYYTQKEFEEAVSGTITLIDTHTNTEPDNIGEWMKIKEDLPFKM